MPINSRRLPTTMLLATLLAAGSHAATTHYVDLNSTNPIAPFTSWTTAATNIQDAINAAAAADLVLVTDGIYQTGATLASGSNRVAVTQALTLASVNGPAFTTIQGYQTPGSTNGSNAIRCVYLTERATLSGFTLTNGGTGPVGYGGGVFCYMATVTNCFISGNSASQLGGGAYEGTLNNCILSGNSSGGQGGGTYDSVLNGCIVSNCTAWMYGAGLYGGSASNCLIIGNQTTLGRGGGAAGPAALINCILANNVADNGGGAWNAGLLNCLVLSNAASYPPDSPGSAGGTYSCSLSNCTVVGNSNPNNAVFNSSGGDNGSRMVNCIVCYNTGASAANFLGSQMSYCCTTPLAAGAGNITNDPGFVNLSLGDFHLQSNSPCINSGSHSPAASKVDLDGNPRVVGGKVDIGAYEFQAPTSVISYAWLQQYGLPTDGSVDFADTDGSGMNTWQKWKAGLDPTNPSSVLAMLVPARTSNSNGIAVSWQSVNTRNYYLQRSLDLEATPTFLTIKSNITGQVGTTTFNDATATNSGPYFYRVGVTWN